MSAAAARATRPATRPAVKTAGRSATYLRLVATRRSNAAKAPFVAAVVGILALGLLGLLVLNTVLAQDAFRLHALQVQGHVLADQEQALQRNVEQLQSPQSLAARATALHMVPGGPPVFLELPSGTVRGVAVPGPAAVVPNPLAAPAAPVAKPKPQPKPVAPAAGTWVPVPAQHAKPTRPAKPATASGGHR